MCNCRIKSASSKDGTPVPGAIISLGQSCHLPGSFQGPIYAAYFAKDYVQGIRENILAGGDSCSRAVVAGAMLAAQVRTTSLCVVSLDGSTALLFQCLQLAASVIDLHQGEDFGAMTLYLELCARGYS